MKSYYVPSGKYSTTAFVLFFFSLVLIVPFLAMLYGFLLWLLPWLLNFFITIGFGFAISFMVNYIVVKYGKVRNVKLAFIMGSIASIIAWYLHWTTWTYLISNFEGDVFWQSIRLLFRPATMWELIGQINETGTWGVFDFAVNGWILGIIWIVEWGMIVANAVIHSDVKAKKPFCEKSNKWFKEKKLSPLTYIPVGYDYRSALENEDPSFWDNIRRADKKLDHSVFTLFFSQQDEYFLSIENKKAKVDDEGKLEFEWTTLIENIAIKPEWGRQLNAFV